MLSECCLSCLSVTVYCGQTVGWISTEVGLCPGHNVRWGPSSPQKGHSSAIFERLLWPNGWTDQDATWYKDRPQPRSHCVRWGTTSPKEHSSPPIFGPCPLSPNGWMDQDANWYGGRPHSKRHCVRWGPSSPSQKRGTVTAPHFLARLLWPNGWIDQDATRYEGRPRPHCVRWGPSSLPKKAQQPPNFWPMYTVAKWLDISRCHLVWRLGAQATLC